MRTLPLVLLLSACEGRGAPVDTGEPAPWDALEATALDPFRLMMTVALSQAREPTRILVHEELQLSFLLDAAGGQVLAMDARYHHTGVAQCVDTEYWPSWYEDRFRGGCPSGMVELNRGVMSAPDGLLTATVSGDALYLISADGGLFRVELDPLEAHPFDLLRVNDGVSLEGVTSLTDPRLSEADGALWLADGDRIWQIDPDGSMLASYGLPAEVVDLDGDRALTEGGAWIDGGLVPLRGSRIRADGDVTWVSDPADAVLRRIEGGSSEPWTVEGLTGPFDIDEITGRIYLAVEGGVTAVADGAVLGTWDLGRTPLDVVVTGHEILLLFEGGDIEVRYDEEALAGGATLDFVMTTFVEKPRTPEENLECFGSEDSVDVYVATALVNRTLLDDLPAPSAVGITPHAARRIRSCYQKPAFTQLWDAPRTEVGVLYHEEDESCEADIECHDAYLLQELGVVEDLGAEVTWVSGMGPYPDFGIDPFQALERIGAPDRYLFYGLGLLPEIQQFDDPRGKEPYPLTRGGLSRALRVASVDEIASGGGDEGISLYPGDTVAAFSQGGCPNLLVYECLQLGVAGAANFDDEDLEVLDLLLHRALAARPDEGVSTWSFHLPDLGPYDYTGGCAVDDRIWSGEDCIGARLQGWQLDLHQRFVLNGLMRWSLPSELERP